MVEAMARLFKLLLLTHVTTSPRSPVAWVTKVPLIKVSLYGVLELPLTAQQLHMSSILVLGLLVAGVF